MTSTSTTFVPRRPVGAFRGSLLGFLAGACSVTAVGFYALFDKYTTASSLMLQSIEELKASSVELESYTKRIERLEGQWKELAARSATKADLDRLERESRSLYDEANLTTLDLKRAVWGLEEDTRALLQERARTVRIS